jgi:hypothetical protein
MSDGTGGNNPSMAITGLNNPVDIGIHTIYYFPMMYASSQALEGAKCLNTDAFGKGTMDGTPATAVHSWGTAYKSSDGTYEIEFTTKTILVADATHSAGILVTMDANFHDNADLREG